MWMFSFLLFIRIIIPSCLCWCNEGEKKKSTIRTTIAMYVASVSFLFVCVFYYYFIGQRVCRYYGSHNRYYWLERCWMNNVLRIERPHSKKWHIDSTSRENAALPNLLRLQLIKNHRHNKTEAETCVFFLLIFFSFWQVNNTAETIGWWDLICFHSS